jgi:hypothetical protein
MFSVTPVMTYGLVEVDPRFEPTLARFEFAVYFYLSGHQKTLVSAAPGDNEEPLITFWMPLRPRRLRTVAIVSGETCRGVH